MTLRHPVSYIRTTANDSKCEVSWVFGNHYIIELIWYRAHLRKPVEIESYHTHEWAPKTPDTWHFEKQTCATSYSTELICGKRPVEIEPYYTYEWAPKTPDTWHFEKQTCATSYSTELICGKRPVETKACHKEPYILSKEPYILSKEPYILSEEPSLVSNKPCVLSTSW